MRRDSSMILSVFLISSIISVSLSCVPSPKRIVRARAEILRAVPGQVPTERLGTIESVQRGPTVRISGTVSGLTPGLHGFHVHENGDLSNGCSAAGAHFNPTNTTHGGPSDQVRHVGDLGNILAGDNNVSTIDIRDRVISLIGQTTNIVGRAFVIHSGQDDLGRGGTPDSLTTGNSGSRVACGVIRLV